MFRSAPQHRPTRPAALAAAAPPPAGARAAILAGLLRSLEALRPHQWAKNLLVLVPAILGGADTAGFVAAAIAFAAMCLVASSGYLVNDLADLAHDRGHWSKHRRPLARGAVPAGRAVVIAAAAALAGLSLAAGAGLPTLACVSAYAAAALAYSLGIKRIAVADVIAIAGLFTLRLVVGVAAAGVILSAWLITFSMFLFLSLALAKRHTELARARLGGRPLAGGRGYRAEDEPVVLALGVGALVAAVVVFVLYLTEEAFWAARLAAPKLLWAFPPLVLAGGARIWLASGRGALDDDPVAFALRDRVGLAILAVLAVVFAAAWIGPLGR